MTCARLASMFAAAAVATLFQAGPIGSLCRNEDLDATSAELGLVRKFAFGRIAATVGAIGHGGIHRRRIRTLFASPATASRLDEPEQRTAQRSLEPGGDTELLQDVVDVKIDRPRTEPEDRSDVVRRFSARHPNHDLALPIGQRAEWRRGAALARQPVAQDFNQQLEVQRLGDEIVATETARAKVALATAISS